MDFKQTILLIEDDLESNKNLVYLLSQKFTNVLSAHDGVEGWKLYQTHQPSIVISDIQMPCSDGLELIRKIRDVNQECFIAVLSAYSDQHYLMRAISLKLDTYILKPINTLKLSSLYQEINTHRQRLHKQIYSLSSDSIYDFMSKTISKEGKRITLANREISLLELLLEHRGEVVSYEMIEYALYDTEETSRNAIKILISHLRKKLDIDIDSIPKIGYIFR